MICDMPTHRLCILQTFKFFLPHINLLILINMMVFMIGLIGF